MTTNLPVGQPALLPYDQAKSFLQQKRIVAFGGGHGLGRLLASLHFLKNNLTGVVTTTDNGGSTGDIRKQSHSIAWGDIRNCLSQLTQNKFNRQLLDFQFEQLETLKQHKLGNLILFAMNELTQSPIEGIRMMQKLLRVESQLYPMSIEATDLLANFSHDTPCRGELHIDTLNCIPDSLQLEPSVSPPSEVLEHILSSDCIILGPGSFLTSVLPPLLIPEIASAIQQKGTPILFIDNLSAEQSSAGQLILAEKMAWLHIYTQGITPDAIVTGPQTAYSEGYTVGCNTPIFDTAIADKKVSYRHHKRTLVQAIASTYLALEHQKYNK